VSGRHRQAKSPLRRKHCAVARPLAAVHESPSTQVRENAMTLSIAHITPLAALIAGILILIMPRLLNFIVAIYLIIVGLVGLNAIHHFIR
jgi:hypothetical protein